MKLIYSNDMVFPWKFKGSISFRGYFIYDFKLYKDDEAIDFIEFQLKKISLNDVLNKMNGLFSIVIDDKEKAEVYLIVDRLRSLPLFYSSIEGNFLVSNTVESIREERDDLSIDYEAVSEISLTEKFVTENKTLIKEIKQVKAGQYVVFNKENQRIMYVDYFIHGEVIQSDINIEKTFSNVFKDTAINLGTLLNGRTAIIPLTGGVDSRAVLLMLSSINYSNVICYTCGKKNSKEIKIAEKVAKNFGYKWIGIDYTKKKWENLSNQKYLEKYRIFSGNYSSLPHILEIIGVEELKRNGHLPPDSVFIPGHAGAIVGGRIPNEFHEKNKMNLNEFNEIMIREFYMGNSKGLNFFDSSQLQTQQEFLNYFHEFEMKERQAKFICNSVRLYEFFGYEWALPLCDANLLEYMKRVPLPYKKHKKIVRDYMGMSHIESTADQSLHKKIANSIRRIPKIRKSVRKLSKISKYWTDPLQTSGLYGKESYFRTMSKSNEFFSINTIEKEALLSKLKRDVSDQ